MRIKTREELREFIKRKLGSPLLKVELTEDMLDDCINRAIEIYSEYAYDGTSTGSLLIKIKPELDENGNTKPTYPLDITLPDNVIAVSDISINATSKSSGMGDINLTASGATLGEYSIQSGAISQGSNSFSVSSMMAQMAKISSIKSMFSTHINFDYNWNTKILRIFEDPKTTTILMEVGLDYEPLEVDNIYNNQWVKKRAEGEAWVQWSTVMGKYSGRLVNDSEINYSDMLSKGERIIDNSEEELQGLFEPLGIWVF